MLAQGQSRLVAVVLQSIDSSFLRLFVGGWATPALEVDVDVEGPLPSTSSPDSSSRFTFMTAWTRRMTVRSRITGPLLAVAELPELFADCWDCVDATVVALLELLLGPADMDVAPVGPLLRGFLLGGPVSCRSGSGSC